MRKVFYTLLILWCAWGQGFKAFRYSSELTARETKSLAVNALVVNVSGIRSQCTGVIGKRNYIITAKHCVQDESVAYQITFWDGKWAVGVVVFESKDQDLAIIKVDTYGYPVAAFAAHVPLTLGDPVYHIRYILSEGGQFRSNGIYAMNDCEVFEGCYHIVAMAGIPGDSGGALFTYDTNEVIGITSSSFWPIGAPMTMFVPIEEAVEWLDNN